MNCTVMIEDMRKLHEVMTKLCITIFAFIISVIDLSGQSYSYVHYDAKDGLPSSTVYDITQDANGFIWFGTENGMCRFDGKNFRTYTTKNGLPDNSILRVHGDNRGRLYFAPFTHGLYYMRNDSIFKVPLPDKYRLDLLNVTNILSKGRDVVVAGNVECYVLKGDSIVSFFDLFRKHATDLLARVYDTLIIARSADSVFYFRDSGKNSAYPWPNHDPRQVFDENGQVRQIEVPPDPNIMVAGYFHPNLLYYRSGNWLNLVSTSTGQLVHKIYVEKYSDALLDNENNLWIATVGNGVYRYPSFGFRHFPFDGKSEVFSLAWFNNEIVAGSGFSKIYGVSPDNKTEQTSTTDLSGFSPGSPNPWVRIHNANRVYALRTENNTLYIGTDGFMVKKTASAMLTGKGVFPVKDIDIEGTTMLVCTGRFVATVDKQSLKIKDTLLNQRSTCGVIYHGDYYVGTFGGLIKIDSGTKKITELYSSLPALRERITAVKRGRDDDLWIATSGSGLVHFKNGEITETLKEEDGLTSNICTSILVDSGLLWLGTNSGLNRIDITKQKPTIIRFTSANGLGADFINSVLATDSDVYVGTSAGLTIFRKNIQSEQSVCILHILDVSENNKTLKNDSSFTFAHDALNIQIRFTAISFKSAGDITYYYRLQGLENKWNTTTANFVNFPTLQPKTYTLLLKAVNKFGVESETKSIQIIIQPPWWQTWFFRIAVLVAIGLIVLLVYSYNIRMVKKRESTKREIEAKFAALEQKALQAQMNPHFIFNCLNSIQTFILNFDAEGANTYLTTFASLIRQTLDNSMQPLIPVSHEIKYLETYLELEKLRFREKFRYQLYVDETVDLNNTLLPGMFFQPYVENSLRHGIQHRKDNNGLISVSVNKTDNHCILYTITDNGVGRRKAMELKSMRHIEYQSRGTSINEKRVAAINNQFNTNITVQIEDITGTDGIVVGTRVSVLIPPFVNKSV